jgi:hypothetical protein
MKRRTLLKLGLGAAALLAVVGGGLALLRPGLIDGRLSPEARRLMRAVALAVFDDALLPPAGPAREAALDQHLDRLDANIAGFPAGVRAELSQLLALLGSSGGRLALLGMRSDWAEASVAELQAMLEGLRLSTLDTRQQIYHALRDLSCVTFFTDPSNWSLVGYPGPRAIP